MDITELENALSDLDPEIIERVYQKKAEYAMNPNTKRIQKKRNGKRILLAAAALFIASAIILIPAVMIRTPDKEPDYISYKVYTGSSDFGFSLGYNVCKPELSNAYISDSSPWYKNDTALQEQQITIGNNTHIGIYKNSIKNMWNNGNIVNVDLYSIENDDGSMLFEAGTAKFISITLNKPAWNAVSEPVITREEAINKAKEIASEFISVDAYTLNFSEETGMILNPQKEMYSVCFIKQLGGMDTTDMFTVIMTKAGELVSAKASNTGGFDQYETVPEFNEERVVASVRDAIRRMYPDTGFTFETKKRSWSLTAKSLMLISHVEVHFENGENSSITIGTELK